LILQKFLPPIFMEAMRDNPEASVTMFEGDLPRGTLRVGSTRIGQVHAPLFRSAREPGANLERGCSLQSATCCQHHEERVRCWDVFFPFCVAHIGKM
jgi:hypothetical protein